MSEIDIVLCNFLACGKSVGTTFLYRAPRVQIFIGSCRRTIYGKGQRPPLLAPVRTLIVRPPDVSREGLKFYL